MCTFTEYSLFSLIPATPSVLTTCSELSFRSHKGTTVCPSVLMGDFAIPQPELLWIFTNANYISLGLACR